MITRAKVWVRCQLVLSEKTGALQGTGGCQLSPLGGSAIRHTAHGRAQMPRAHSVHQNHPVCGGIFGSFEHCIT